VDGIARIRFTTSHPRDLSEEMVDAMARLDKVCEHLHLPVQSGSSRVLSAMGRGYTREDYLARVRSLRNRIPGIALTTDIIVGFPGETEEEFRETITLLEAVRFDGMYSFKYSPRPMTRAYDMGDSVPESAKVDRLARVQAVQDGITDAILEGCVGTVEDVLITGPSPRGQGQVTGRTRSHRIVHAPGDPDRLRGRLVPVRIERSLRHSLWGRPLE
jgi:tRNA-2-methylthio-N6-dimethylallyladenosine synthase